MDCYGTGESVQSYDGSKAWKLSRVNGAYYTHIISTYKKMPGLLYYDAVMNILKAMIMDNHEKINYSHS